MTSYIIKFIKNIFIISSRYNTIDIKHLNHLAFKKMVKVPSFHLSSISKTYVCFPEYVDNNKFRLIIIDLKASHQEKKLVEATDDIEVVVSVIKNEDKKLLLKTKGKNKSLINIGHTLLYIDTEEIYEFCIYDNDMPEIFELHEKINFPDKVVRIEELCDDPIKCASERNNANLTALLISGPQGYHLRIPIRSLEYYYTNILSNYSCISVGNSFVLKKKNDGPVTIAHSNLPEFAVGNIVKYERNLYRFGVRTNGQQALQSSAAFSFDTEQNNDINDGGWIFYGLLWGGLVVAITISVGSTYWGYIKEAIS